MINPFRKASVTWPPPFHFRRSSRAKRISLRIDPERGLEVVLPQKTPERQGLHFLNEHSAWIEKHVDKLPLDNAHAELLRYVLPKQLKLPLLHHMWRIDYCQIQAAKRVSMATSNDRLVFFGRFDHFKPCTPLMKEWLKNQAKIFLPEILKNVAKDCRLSFRKVGVRSQKTMWGSCNEYKDIQLNYKLIFLPEVLVRYVMIHELCHTVHMNHSKSFWKLVEKHMPNYETQLHELKHTEQWIPKWL